MAILINVCKALSWYISNQVARADVSIFVASGYVIPDGVAGLLYFFPTIQLVKRIMLKTSKPYVAFLFILLNMLV
jgi:hypothetical protein